MTRSKLNIEIDREALRTKRFARGSDDEFYFTPDAYERERREVEAALKTRIDKSWFLYLPDSHGFWMSGDHRRLDPITWTRVPIFNMSTHWVFIEDDGIRRLDREDLRTGGSAHDPFAGLYFSRVGMEREEARRKAMWEQRAESAAGERMRKESRRAEEFVREAYDNRDADTKLLGVGELASVTEIRAAFRNLAKTHHPDRGGSPEMFHTIKSAYDRLLKLAEIMASATFSRTEA